MIAFCHGLDESRQSKPMEGLHGDRKNETVGLTVVGDDDGVVSVAGSFSQATGGWICNQDKLLGRTP